MAVDGVTYDIADAGGGRCYGKQQAAYMHRWIDSDRCAVVRQGGDSSAALAND